MALAHDSPLSSWMREVLPGFAKNRRRHLGVVHHSSHCDCTDHCAKHPSRFLACRGTWHGVELPGQIIDNFEKRGSHGLSYRVIPPSDFAAQGREDAPVGRIIAVRRRKIFRHDGLEPTLSWSYGGDMFRRGHHFTSREFQRLCYKLVFGIEMFIEAAVSQSGG